VSTNAGKHPDVMRETGKYYTREKVKGCNTRIFPCKVTSPRFHHATRTHLCPQLYIMPASNPKSALIQEIRRGWEFHSGSNVTGPRSKVTEPRFYHATHLCPLIHHACKYHTNPKSAFVWEIQNGREFKGQRSLGQSQRSQRHDASR
jgi:hypothetical protein